MYQFHQKHGWTFLQSLISQVSRKWFCQLREFSILEYSTIDICLSLILAELLQYYTSEIQCLLTNFSFQSICPHIQIWLMYYLLWNKVLVKKREILKHSCRGCCKLYTLVEIPAKWNCNFVLIFKGIPTICFQRPLRPLGLSTAFESLLLLDPFYLITLLTESRPISKPKNIWNVSVKRSYSNCKWDHPKVWKFPPF